MSEIPKDIFFQTDGTRFSYVDRDRGQEQNNMFDVEDVHNLLPRIQQARTAYYVILSNRHGPSPDSAFRNAREIFLRQESITGSIPLSGDNRFLLDMIKFTTGPYANHESDYHSLFLVTNDEGYSVPSFGELSTEASIKLHHIVYDTLEFLEQRYPENRSYVGFSFSPLECRRVATIYDPITEQEHEILSPRSPVQNIATIHAHIASTDETHWKLDSRDNREYDQRMLREPMLVQLNELFYLLVYRKVIDQFPDIEHELFSVSDRSNAFPKGILQVFPRHIMNSPRFGEYIQALHQEAERAYRNLADTVIVTDDLYQGRITYRSVSERQRLQEQFINTFIPDASIGTKHFVRWLGDLSHPDTMVDKHMDFVTRAQIAESFMMLGLSYNIVYYFPKGREDIGVVAIHPRIISGASPTETVGIIKQQEPVTSTQFKPIRDRTIVRSEALFQWLVR